MVEQQHRAQWRLHHSTDLAYASYLRMARTKSTSSNGISGIKLHYYQALDIPGKLDEIPSYRGLTFEMAMATLFPRARYIWLTRRDKARQAISFFLAARTNRWWLTDGSPLKVLNIQRQYPRFDPMALARLESRFIQHDLAWQAYFESRDITPLVVCYEELATSYTETIIRVLEWLEVADAGGLTIAPPRLRRQSNGRNEEWLAKYLAFKRDRGFDPSKSELAESTDVLSELAQAAKDVIPDVWKQWVAQSKLRGWTDDAIVEVLTTNGYACESAWQEVKTASLNPYLVGAIRTYRADGRTSAATRVGSDGSASRVRRIADYGP